MRSVVEEIAAPFRAIIVDDEELGRELVRKLADDAVVVNVVGEFSDGEHALKAFDALKPDVVFLDIKMPRRDGIATARALCDRDALIVFITAFEKHALEAFSVRAFDYILKPIDKERFSAVVSRLHQSVRRKRLARAVDTNAVALTPPARESLHASRSRIKIRDGSRLHFLDLDNVIWFEAANQYVQIHTRNGDFLISSESLNSLQEKADGDKFVRVHRSALVNVNFVSAIRVDEKGAYQLEMSNGDRVKVSRSNRGALKNLDV
ncbi:MAG: response regulator transcription factor [Rhodomicrobium sp.]|nr:response regulator transcription factor [Rhodomicrobium sp.]